MSDYYRPIKREGTHLAIQTIQKVHTEEIY